MMVKKAITTIAALASYTQENTKGNKTMGGGALNNKCKPKPRAKPQERVMMAKRSCSFEVDVVSLEWWHKCMHTHKAQVVYRQC